MDPRVASQTFERVLDVLFGAEPLAFESDFGLDETVRRLSTEIKRPLANFRPLLSLDTVAAVGNVSDQEVYVWCERLFMRNGFKPVFSGTFHLVGKRVILIGKLTNPAICAVVVAWFVVTTVWTFGVLLEVAKNPFDLLGWCLLLSGPISFFVVVGAGRFAKWLSSDDERWILTAIASALRRSPSQ